MVMASLEAAESKKAGKVRPSQAFIMLLDNLARQVPERQYKVHLSADIVARPEWLTYQVPITNIIERLKKGESITHCLSVTSTDIDKPDRLLSYWGINHLHLVLDGPRKTEFPSIAQLRTPHHLYFRVNGEDFHCIDLLSHPPRRAPAEWIDAHLVRVVDEHWPHLHRLYKSDSSSSEKISDADHKAIFSNGANALVTTKRGLVLPAGGLMADRKYSLESTVRWGSMVRMIEKLQAYVALHHDSLFPGEARVERYLSLIEVEVGGTGFHVYDALSKTKAIIRFA